MPDMSSFEEAYLKQVEKQNEILAAIHIHIANLADATQDLTLQVKHSGMGIEVQLRELLAGLQQLTPPTLPTPSMAVPETTKTTAAPSRSGERNIWTPKR